MPKGFLHLIEPHRICHEEAYAALDREEQGRADAFIFEDERRRWTCVRAEVRRLLAGHLGMSHRDLRWTFLEHGKPKIEGHELAFNLSHSPRLSVLAISAVGPIGVDIEPRERGSNLIQATASFCHPEEIAHLPNDGVAEALIELWTAKEAFLKALGTGFSQAPQEIFVRGDRAIGPLPQLEELHLLRPSKHIFLDSYSVALAVPRAIGEIELTEQKHESW